MKSEPSVFSIDDLRSISKQTDHWDGVRNYQARNFMKSMKRDDQAFFYHSNCNPPGIAGIMTVVKEAYPDFTAMDEKSSYFDPKSTSSNPRWFMVNVKFKRKLKKFITLEELRQHKDLNNLSLLKKGNRLSIMPLSKKEWDIILHLG
jgi:predicted RNA-binding protein with PUA-like domain|tara:strand:- start:397 stop:837 length:441 start_codon:yes stop_codon:yes gene_type:complete